MNEEIVIPSLNLNNDKLSDPQDKLAYLIKFVLLSPGFTSSFMEHSLISFRKLEAAYGRDKGNFASILQEKLNGAVFNMFPDAGYKVSVTTEDNEDGTGFAVTISITNASGVPVIGTDKIYVTDGNNLNINYVTGLIKYE